MCHRNATMRSFTLLSIYNIFHIALNSINVRMSSCSVAIFFSIFNQIWSLSTDFLKSSQPQISRKYRHWKLLWCGEAGGHDEANGRFSLFTPTLLKVSEQLETPLALSVIQEAAAISVSQMKPVWELWFFFSVSLHAIVLVSVSKP